MGTAIEINGIGKRYRLGVDATGYDTLRDALLRTVLQRRSRVREAWALKDVNLEVAQGEALGVIGDNAAGKTTLLKVLAGITEPTTGEARVRGRVGALLDVGTGFHPELTGRENVYLSGAILGLRRYEISDLLEQIIAFSGLERFVDTPVKRYSAGMRLRLAFAVAAHIRPAVLVVDEILAVGDAAFQEKCLGRMAEISDQDRTVLFVSHDLGAVARLCSRVVWLKDGQIHRDGDPHEIIADYRSTGVGANVSIDFAPSEREVTLVHASLRDLAGMPVAGAARGEPLILRFRVAVHEDVPGLDIAIHLDNEAGTRIIEEAYSGDGRGQSFPRGRGEFETDIRIPPLLPAGRYAVTFWVGTMYEDFEFRQVMTFPVYPQTDDSRVSIERQRAIQPLLEWTVVRKHD